MILDGAPGLASFTDEGVREPTPRSSLGRCVPKRRKAARILSRAAPRSSCGTLEAASWGRFLPRPRGRQIDHSVLWS